MKFQSNLSIRTVVSGSLESNQFPDPLIICQEWFNLRGSLGEEMPCFVCVLHAHSDKKKKKNLDFFVLQNSCSQLRCGCVTMFISVLKFQWGDVPSAAWKFSALSHHRFWRRQSLHKQLYYRRRFTGNYRTNFHLHATYMLYIQKLVLNGPVCCMNHYATHELVRDVALWVTRWAGGYTFHRLSKKF